MLRANIIIAVLFTPVEGAKIPEWEMMLSAGAVCQNLLVAAQFFNYAAQWLTEWYAYNNKMIEELENQNDLENSIENYQNLLKLNSIIEKKFQKNTKNISEKTREKISKITSKKNAK